MISNLKRTELINGVQKTETIPTLEEVFELVKNTNIKLNIELKVYRENTSCLRYF